jgi:excinuclease UvrABC nuclease subunit
MDERDRHPVIELSQLDIPADPGVYAFYRGGDAIYVGKAASLRARLWTNHLRQGSSMTNSALRRNVAAHLGIASSADIKARRYLSTVDDAAKVSSWISECEVAWIECATEFDAVLLETALKTEAKPPLTRI